LPHEAPNVTAHGRHPVTVADSLREYGRGIAGGFLFSLPMLLTMEVWSAGVTASPLRLLVGLIGTFGLLCAYNTYAGLRYDTGALEIAIDSVEELGLGLLLSAGVLALTGRIDSSTGVSEAIGKIVVEGLAVAIGVSVGTAQISKQDDDQGAPQGRHATIGSELTLALCGTFLVAANVAPTDEVVVLAIEMTVWQLLAAMAASAALAAMLMYHSGFVGTARFAGTPHTAVVHGAIITYAVALVGSAAALWFFDRFDDHAPEIAAAQCVVLALPGTLGAAAGRALLR
jgi:putative integral membrane protein (TIGR02587 family)